MSEMSSGEVDAEADDLGSTIAVEAVRQPGSSSSLAPQWRRRLGRILLLADALAIASASLAAYVLRDVLGMAEALRPFKNEVPVALAVLPLWLVIYYAFGCYRPNNLNTSGDAFRRFSAATFGGLLLTGFTSFALNLQLSRIYVLAFSLFVLLLGGCSRLLLRRYLVHQRSRGMLVQRVVIAGADREAIEVANALARAPYAGYSVVGFLADDRAQSDDVDGEHVVLGPLASAVEISGVHGASLVLVSPTAVPAGTLGDLIVALEGSPVDVAIAPSLFEVVTRRVAVENVGNVPILHVSQIRIAGARALLKRAIDVVGSLALITVLWPLMLAIAIVVRREDGFPALFRQVRVGQDGQEFVLLKFRTMEPDAEEKRGELSGINEAGEHLFKVRNDPRMTRVGRFLRRWSLDEIPQFWNVLRGDMSLIGPRPALPEEVEDYDDWQGRRLRARPGISGYWQVSGRSDVPFDEAVRLDLFYIANWSLGFDLYLMLRTVRAVFSRAGAY